MSARRRHPSFARLLVRLTPRRGTALLTGLAAITCLGVAVWPLVQPPLPVASFEPIGVQVVHHPDSERIDGVLARRGPGLGMRLRE